ncbi:MAG: hypothetical protein ACTSX8_07070 [Alphaproteobacteria bacterium]
MNAADFLLTMGFGVAGAFVGWVYCFLVRYSVAHLSMHKKQVAKFVALMFVRVALIGGGLFGAACFGPWPVISHMAGFFVMRTVMLMRARSETPAASDTIEATDTEKAKQVNG